MSLQHSVKARDITQVKNFYNNNNNKKKKIKNRRYVEWNKSRFSPVNHPHT